MRLVLPIAATESDCCEARPDPQPGPRCRASYDTAQFQPAGHSLAEDLGTNYVIELALTWFTANRRGYLHADDCPKVTERARNYPTRAI